MVASLAMKPKDPRVDEQAAADAIRAVVELLEPPEFEPNGRDTAPDWRIEMTCGRVADVEVIRSTDEDATWFMQSLAPDGSPRVRRDARLSHEWTILVSDLSPATNRGLGIGKLMDSVCDTLASVESEHYSPEQMKEIARWELRLNAELMPKTIANATVDRLLHHAHVVMTAGDSIRLTQATAGKGVTPLTN